MNRAQLNDLIAQHPATLAERGIAAPPAARTTSAIIPLRPNDVDLGTADDTGGPVGLDLARLLDGRLLIQGASGAGKSWTLRRLLEQTHGRIQQIVIDPEGEFRSIADRYGHVHVDASRLDTFALATAAERAREHRLSLVLDLSDLERERQMQACAAFLQALIDAPKEAWHPAVVAIDEVHLLAPHGGQTSEAPVVRKASIAAVVDLMSRGRKRGLCGVLATQRLTRLSKSVVSEATNFLIGLNTLDLDVRRAAETIGWGARMAFDRLPMLLPGQFVGVGAAFNRSPAIVKVGGIETVHRGARPEISAPETLTENRAAELLDLEALMESTAADEADRSDARLPEGYRNVRAFIREPAFGMAGVVWNALRPLAPSGAVSADLREHLGVSADDVAAAVALLDRYGVIEIAGDGGQAVVRIAPAMLK